MEQSSLYLDGERHGEEEEHLGNLIAGHEVGRLLVQPHHSHATLYLLALMMKKASVHCKKWLNIFPSPAGMSLTKLSLSWNNLIIPDQREFGK
jgi:hypothetical protein